LTLNCAKVSLNAESVFLANGNSTLVYLTPLELSDVADDVLITALLALQNVGTKTATVGDIYLRSGNSYETVQRVRSSTSPVGMTADRIPPRVTTPFKLHLSGPLKDNVTVTLAIFNQSADNGTAAFALPILGYPAVVNRVTIKAGDLSWESSGGPFYRAYYGHLIGLSQTSPADDPFDDPIQYLNKLRLGLLLPGKNTPNASLADAIAIGAQGFSVSAIPIGIRMSNPLAMKGDDTSADPATVFRPAWGVMYEVEYVSDSGVLEDMDKVKVSENLDPSDRIRVSGYQTPSGDAIDAHGHQGRPAGYDPTQVTYAMARELARAAVVEYLKRQLQLTEQDSIDIKQYFTFTDARTSSFDEIPRSALRVKHSGFEIRYTIRKVQVQEGLNLRYQYWINISKAPSANNSANLGYMSVEDTQTIADRVN